MTIDQHPIPSGVSRRDFLTRMGVVGGATAMFGAMDVLGLMASPGTVAPVDFVPPRASEIPRGRGPSVLVLGAGIAGLTTAYELAKAGYSEAPGAWTRSGTPLSPIDRSELLRSRIGNYFAFEFGWNQAMLMFQPVGGMDRIATTLADAVGRGRITYGAEVLELSNTSSGVEVLYRGRGSATRTARADYCVATIPPQILKRIPSNLTTEVVTALDNANPASAGKIGLQHDRRFWEEDDRILGGITNTNMDINTIWYPSTGYLSPKGVLVGYYNFGGSANQYGARSPAQRLSRAVDQGSKIHGPAYAQVEQSLSIDWATVPYSEGGWVGWRSGQGEGSPYRRLLEPDGNVYFAGDHLSHYIAWQAGAFESARQTVMDLHERVVATA